MSTSKVEMKKSKIAPCERVIIKDPFYEDKEWCAYAMDNCSGLTHAKGIATNYDMHYKDANFEFDANTTEFALLLGSSDFVSAISFKVQDNGTIDAFITDAQKYVQMQPVEVGCDRAEFSFGSEKTFGAFTISTGADGSIGDVLTFAALGSQEPIGILFVGTLSGDMVSTHDIMDSFKAAFGAEREKKKALSSKISEAESRRSRPETSDENLGKTQSRDQRDDFGNV